MAKSYKTANIRVTQENETTEGLKVYYKNDIESTLKEWADTANITYWLVEHKADKEVSRTHYHIVIKFRTPTPFANIKSKFPYGNIESSRNIKASIQYLIHLNDKSKVQYPWSDIITNCEDMTVYKIQSHSQEEITIQKVLEDIDKGVIRQYNQYNMIPIEIWSKNKNRIENALTYYRERICMDKNREILVIFLSGDTGTGKTTFAKQYCENYKKSFSISSSSNDPMQDYKGEDVLILDDLRDCDFKFTDLLKILDNHTKSSIKSRYNNKAFIGDTIIITSYRPITDWYHDVPKESKEQLYRRIKVWYKFTESKINIFQYDDNTKKYAPLGMIDNIIKMKPKANGLIAVKVLEAMGVEFEPNVKEQIINSDEEENNSMFNE